MLWNSEKVWSFHIKTFIALQTYEIFIADFKMCHIYEMFIDLYENFIGSF